MIPPVLNDTGDCCCQCPPSGPDGWCHCNDDYNGKGDDIENAITCDLVWTERQPNGRKKYFKVVSGSSQQNMPVVLPTASLTKRGVVQLTNDLSDREDLALTPKAVKGVKEQLDRETADRVAKDTDLQNQINKEKADRANADADLLSKINQEKADRANADNALSNRITSAESKADSALSKANKAVTSVTSNGNATVTVTKADGTSNSFTINNVAHATSADNATHATNADHATVADELASGSVLGIPNYAKGTSFINIPSSTTGTFTQTADKNGFVTVYGGVGIKTSEVIVIREVGVWIRVNNTVIANAGQNGMGSFWQGIHSSFFVKKGDVVSITLSDSGDSFNSYITNLIFPLE